jgi:hypothetical protein
MGQFEGELWTPSFAKATEGGPAFSTLRRDEAGFVIFFGRCEPATRIAGEGISGNGEGEAAKAATTGVAEGAGFTAFYFWMRIAQCPEGRVIAI